MENINTPEKRPLTDNEEYLLSVLNEDQARGEGLFGVSVEPVEGGSDYEVPFDYGE